MAGQDRKEDIKEVVAFDSYPNLMKSNLLIGAKYKASLMELRVTYAALFMLQNNKYTEEPDGFYVTMYPAELKKFLGVEGHSIYEALEPVAKSMTNRSIGFSDPVNKTFDYINLINRARYEDGVFIVKFNKDMQDYIIDLKSNFTNLNRLTMMSFSSAYSFRLYELLKQQCFYPSSYQGERNNVFAYNVGLAELKFNLGVINAELDEVRKILSAGNKPDYEKAEAKSPEKINSYGNWSNFKAKCLEVAVREINSCDASDIYVTYEPVRVGRGGKVKAIDFTIYLNGAEKKMNATAEANTNAEPEIIIEEKPVIELDETTKFQIKYEVLQSLLKYGLKIEDVDSICNEANYDIDRIKNAIRLMETRSEKIMNITGWLLSALREGYTETSREAASDKQSAGKSTASFEEREYDFNAMEAALFNNKKN